MDSLSFNNGVLSISRNNISKPIFDTAVNTNCPT